MKIVRKRDLSSLSFKLVESCRSAVLSVKAHGFRSFLTTLGIIIGVASVIAVVSVVQGLSSSITAQFDGMGTNVVSINSHTPLEERLQGKIAKLTYRDFLEIKHKVQGIKNVTPTVAAVGPNGLVQYKSESTTTRVIGTGASYQALYGIYPELGRFFNSSDDKTRRRVAVLGPSIVEKLEMQGEVVGQYIKIGGEWFKVIGVLEKLGKMFGFDQDDYVLLPYSTTQALLGGAEEPDISISLQVINASDIDQVKQHITNIVRRSHGLSDGDSDDFKISTAEQMLDTVNKITSNTTMVLSGVVGISLLVGGIGIMNIMLVSVTERTREIGIQKALGATRIDILLQFLIEAVVLCLLGGLIGLALGYGAGALVSSAIDLPEAQVPMWAVMLSFGFSAGVGLLFGIIPAAKAANLDPIDALRYE